MIQIDAIAFLGNILSFFGIGGGSDESRPRQDDHGRHPVWLILDISPGLTPTQKKAKCDCPTAPVLPNGSVDDNSRATQRYGSAYFAWQVWKGHAWDFTRYPGGMKWDDAGNFNYGACGRAAGFSNYTLLNAGSQLQKHEGTYQPGNGIPFLWPPYGENKSDMIQAGERYYDCGCYK